jgi:ATP-dependent Zn protease
MTGWAGLSLLCRRTGNKDHLEQAEGGEMTETTLDDVAGCDEAKAELKEVIDYLKDPTRCVTIASKADGVTLASA